MLELILKIELNRTTFFYSPCSYACRLVNSFNYLISQCIALRTTFPRGDQGWWSLSKELPSSVLSWTPHSVHGAGLCWVSLWTEKCLSHLKVNPGAIHIQQFVLTKPVGREGGSLSFTAGQLPAEKLRLNNFVCPLPDTHGMVFICFFHLFWFWYSECFVLPSTTCVLGAQSLMSFHGDCEQSSNC